MENATVKKISDLQPGDRVIVAYGWNTDSVATVDRVTKTQIILKDGSRYNSAGRKIGGDKWSRNHISVATEDRLAAVKLKHRNKQLANLNLRIAEDDSNLINEVYDFLLSKGLIK